NRKVAGSNPAPATNVRKSQNSPFNLQTIHQTVCITIKPRQPHNLKVSGSNPRNATTIKMTAQGMSYSGGTSVF
ncbi:MAG: hypothetical protein AAF408_13315, partial [Pseudomonadota bacterium]